MAALNSFEKALLTFLVSEKASLIASNRCTINSIAATKSRKTTRADPMHPTVKSSTYTVIGPQMWYALSTSSRMSSRSSIGSMPELSWQ